MMKSKARPDWETRLFYLKKALLKAILQKITMA